MPHYYYRQKQVLLRNSAGDLDTVKDAIHFFFFFFFGVGMRAIFGNLYQETSSSYLAALYFSSPGKLPKS